MSAAMDGPLSNRALQKPRPNSPVQETYLRSKDSEPIRSKPYCNSISGSLKQNDGSGIACVMSGDPAVGCQLKCLKIPRFVNLLVGGVKLVLLG